MAVEFSQATGARADLPKYLVLRFPFGDSCELFAEASSWAGMGVQAALVLLCWSADRLAPGTLGYVDAASDPYGAAESGKCNGIVNYSKLRRSPETNAVEVGSLS